MSDHVRHEDDAAVYLLGALTDGERADFERHLADCAACRETMDALSPAADALPRAVEPLDAPDSLRRSLMEVVGREARRRRAPARGLRLRGALLGGLRPRLAMAGAAAALVLGVAIGYGAFGTGEESRTVAAKVDSARLPGGSAELEIDGDRGALRVTGLPQPTGERVYMVWLERDGKVSPAGSYFNVGADGSGAAAIPGDLDDVEAIHVTREMEGGVPRPTEGPVISIPV
jgi:anti-sigma factor RsiW